MDECPALSVVDMATGGSIRSAHAPSETPGRALHDLRGQADPDGYALVVLFLPLTADLGAVARAAAQSFPGVAVVGCTTAGDKQ